MPDEHTWSLRRIGQQTEPRLDDRYDDAPRSGVAWEPRRRCDPSAGSCIYIWLSLFSSGKETHERQNDKLESSHVPYNISDWVVPADEVWIIRQDLGRRDRK